MGRDCWTVGFWKRRGRANSIRTLGGVFQFESRGTQNKRASWIFEYAVAEEVRCKAEVGHVTDEARSPVACGEYVWPPKVLNCKNLVRSDFDSSVPFS